MALLSVPFTYLRRMVVINMQKENLKAVPQVNSLKNGEISNMSAPHTTKGGLGESLNHKRQLIEEENNKTNK
jgi:hypothetical protein